MRKILLGTIVPVALAIAFSGAAYAGGFGDVSGTLSGSDTIPTEGSGNLFGGSATVQIPVTQTWFDAAGLEVNGGYHRIDSGGVDFWYVGGALYSGGANGRVAANFMHHSLDGEGYETFGVGGEWFATPSLNLDIRGGGILLAGLHGGYIGAQGTWYVTPDVNISAGGDHLSAGGLHMSGETIKAEWLVSEAYPVAAYGGYQHLQIGAGGGSKSANAIFFGVKLFFNGPGATTLIDRERTGTNGYIVESPMLLDQY
jgi:hypothetical protein